MNRNFGISGSALKMIALITMTIDHIGAVIIQRIMVTEGFNTAFWGSLYQSFRNIGRISFPIFCFLLVEGYHHTKNKRGYLFRMILFAFISELPFNLAVGVKLLEPMHQNVLWEFTMGILLMMVIEKIEKLHGNNLLNLSLIIAVTLAAIWIAEELKFDYGDHGIITIALLYFFRNYRVLQLMAGIISFLWSYWAIWGFLPIAFYNGKRGRQIKYAFYIFYPSHLLLFYMIVRIIGCID